MGNSKKSRLWLNSDFLSRIKNRFSAIFENMENLPPLEDHFLLQKKKKSKELNLKLKRLERSLILSQSNIQNCLDWEKTQHEASILQANFAKLKRGMDQITLLDWSQDKEVILKLDPQLKPEMEVKKRYKTAKKLKLGIIPQQNHFEQLQKQQSQVLEEIKQLEGTETLNDFLVLYPKKKNSDKKNDSKKPLPYREYQSKSGFTILAGKSSFYNDTLTFSVAKGNDLWLHVKDYPGSHVVIRTKKGVDVDPETIDDAVQIAIFHSKAKDANSAEVCLTEQKHVSRFGKEKNGKVQLSKHKVLYAKADPKKFKEIQTRSI